MKTNRKNNKARTRVGAISRFGLMEMSRQRLRQSLETSAFVCCQHCGGKGYVLAADKLGVRFLRKLQLETLKKEGQTVTAVVPTDVADYLLNRKRSELLELETRRNLSITLKGDAAMPRDESKILWQT